MKNKYLFIHLNQARSLEISREILVTKETAEGFLTRSITVLIVSYRVPTLPKVNIQTK
jgi:hypothetical protein